MLYTGRHFELEGEHYTAILLSNVGRWLDKRRGTRGSPKTPLYGFFCRRTAFDSWEVGKQVPTLQKADVIQLFSKEFKDLFHLSLGVLAEGDITKAVAMVGLHTHTHAHAHGHTHTHTYTHTHIHSHAHPPSRTHGHTHITHDHTYKQTVANTNEMLVGKMKCFWEAVLIQKYDLWDTDKW